MEWTHRFRVKAPVEMVYQKGFVPETWFSFFNAYRGLESVDQSLPQSGASIVIRYPVAGRWEVHIRNTVVQHEWGSDCACTRRPSRVVG